MSSKVNFDTIAKRYDLINEVISFGLVNLWRSTFSRLVAEGLKRRSVTIVDQDLDVLEIGVGSGKQLHSVLKKINKLNLKTDHVFGIDQSKEMLKIAQNNVNKWEEKNVRLVNLPLEQYSPVDQKFDLVIMSFALRNIPDVFGALEKSKKLLKPGGQLAVLDFSTPRLLLRPFVIIYERFILWRIARLLGGNGHSYRYLTNSIEKWYTPQNVSYLFEKAGFKKMIVKRSWSGIVCTHIYHSPTLAELEDYKRQSSKPLRSVSIMQNN
ncbi:MAG: class I SAM-dependent methyltransferase [Candidatus Ancillula sp.]|jgi:ubiquinone/menaquinone biosynthesis methyltransferase|nr:class I SAM-dependent methyltransferase [Candidatus Ancillula sp.]